MLDEILKLFDGIFKGVTLKEGIFILVAVFLFYSIMTGRGLLSRILQLAVLLYAGDVFYRSYVEGEYLKAVIDTALVLLVFFAPIVVKNVIKLIKSMLSGSPP